MPKNEISRRTFIKGIAAGAASLATLGVLQRCEYSTSHPKSSSSTSGGGGAAPLNLTYTPGTYSASAKGINGDVTVTMTFDEKSITEVEIDASGETPDIGGKIVDEMRQKILDNQTCNVDGVSGATVTADAIKTAAADCIAQASGQAVAVGGDTANTADWLGAPPEIDEKDIVETVDTEILIVGCGTGGWSATMTAAEQGLKTLTIEKREKPTDIRHDIGAIGSKLQQAAVTRYPHFHIDRMEALQDIVRYASGYVDSDLVRVWIAESGDMVDWLTDILVKSGDYIMEFEGSIGDVTDPGRDKAYPTGHSPQKTAAASKDASTLAVFQKYSEEHGAEIRCNTAMIKLEQNEDGKVTGVIAQDQEDNHYIRINASKGVLLCAGSYTTNTDMMMALQPMTMSMKINLPAGSTCDGSGIKAILWAGGVMDPCHASMMFNRACCLPNETAGYKTNGKMFWFGEQPFLKVNLEGKRFCNESGPYEFMLHSMYMQPKHTYCDIFDSNAKKYCEQFQEVGCCRLFPFDNGSLSNREFDDVWSQMMDGDDSLQKQGYIVKANTLEELAKGLGIPEEAFVETVQRYNQLCTKGSDDDYGKEKHRMTPVDKAPFYGVRVGAWHLTTLDGCRINTDMQVIREDGSVIEGLWAAGDCTGGFFANNYPNLFTGLACGRTMTFARHAVQHIAAQ